MRNDGEGDCFTFVRTCISQLISYILLRDEFVIFRSEIGEVCVRCNICYIQQLSALILQYYPTEYLQSDLHYTSAQIVTVYMHQLTYSLHDNLPFVLFLRGMKSIYFIVLLLVFIIVNPFVSSYLTKCN